MIQAIYDEHGECYGYRRIRDELMNRGNKIKHKKMYHFMKELGLKLVQFYQLVMTKGNNQ